MKPGRQGPAHPLPVIALVLLAHALLGLWLNTAVRAAPRASAADQRATALRLIAVRVLPPASAQPPAPGRSAGARSVAPRAARPPIEHQPVPTAPADATPLVSEAAPAATAGSASTAAPALPALLDSEATRRALRQAAREPRLSERAAAAAQAPVPETAQQRLAREIGQSATGECLKGEYAGGGMGLLSLPFWLLAEARGKCRR